MSVLPISKVSPLVCGRPPPVHGGDHVFDDRQQHPEARAQPRIHDRLGKAAHGCRSRHIPLHQPQARGGVEIRPPVSKDTPLPIRVTFGAVGAAHNVGEPRRARPTA